MKDVARVDAGTPEQRQLLAWAWTEGLDRAEARTAEELSREMKARNVSPVGWPLPFVERLPARPEIEKRIQDDPQVNNVLDLTRQLGVADDVQSQQAIRFGAATMASNAPMLTGLLAGIVGGIVVGLLSQSHTSVSGPAAGLTAIIAAQLTLLGSFEAFLLAVMVVGVIRSNHSQRSTATCFIENRAERPTSSRFARRTRCRIGP